MIMKALRFRRSLGKSKNGKKRTTKSDGYRLVNQYGEVLDIKSVVMKQYKEHMSVEQLCWYFDISYGRLRYFLTKILKFINESLYEMSQKVIHENKHRYRTKRAEAVYQGPSASCKKGKFFSRRTVVMNENKGIFTNIKKTLAYIVHKFARMIKRITNLLIKCCFNRKRFYYEMLTNIKTYINSPELLSEMAA